MSTVTFRHENNKSYKLKGVKHTVKESLIDGEKGLSFMFLKKVGEGDFYKVYAQENKETGKYTVKEKKGEKEETMELSEAEVKKMVKANKDLDFVKEYMEKLRGTYKGKQTGGNSDQCGGGKLQSLDDSNNTILSYLLEIVPEKNCSTINKDKFRGKNVIYNVIKLLLEYVNIYNITMILLVELVKFIINTDTKFTDNLCIVISKIFTFCVTILTMDYFQKGISCNEINTYYNHEVAKLGISRHTLNNIMFVDTDK